jgi:hypothetical protein
VVAERSPSSVLLLRRAEHSAALAVALAHPDGYPDAPGPEVAGLDQRPAGADQSTPTASDASDGAPRDVAEAAAHQPRPHLADAAAGKSAALELDALEPGALQSDAQPPPTPVVQAQPDAEAELYKQDAAQSAEQSFAVPAAVERWEPETQPDAVLSSEEPQTQPAMLQLEPAAQLQLRAAVLVVPDEAAPQPEARALAQYEQVSPLARGRRPERQALAEPM